MPLRQGIPEEGHRVAVDRRRDRGAQTIVRRRQQQRGRDGQGRRRQEEEAPATEKPRGHRCPAATAATVDHDAPAAHVGRLHRAPAPHGQPVRLVQRLQFARHQFHQQRFARTFGLVRLQHRRLVRVVVDVQETWRSRSQLQRRFRKVRKKMFNTIFPHSLIS